ncbi:hypothetical protein [Flavisphingomonas formosensis]|uniref:hypothetical protein n=1 Tax=Flavisphingomonas formosensis TaxID=861534 RepID=UPI0012F75E58|nr:hypothetical protein [Sphingomonas formosensis]
MFAVMIAAAISISHADVPDLGTPRAAAQPADTAAQIAHALAPRENFRSMILLHLNRSEEGAHLAAIYGEQRAASMLSVAADTVANRHAAEWEANMAAAYRLALNGTEQANVLAALRSATPDVPDALAGRVALALYREANPLLERASAETLSAVEAKTTH